MSVPSQPELITLTLKGNFLALSGPEDRLPDGKLPLIVLWEIVF